MGVESLSGFTSLQCWCACFGEHGHSGQLENFRGQSLILLPSLNRAHLVKRFFQAYQDTEAVSPGIVIVDRTDPKLHEYKALSYPSGWELVLTDAVTMGDKFSETYDRYKDCEWVAILNDDHVPKTKHWDQTCIAHLNGTNVVSTNDGPTPDKPWMAPNRICGAIFISGRVVRTLGWLFPNGIQHLYSDDVWGILFGRAQCARVLMDICVHHDHAYKDESQRDETYYKINGKGEVKGHETKGGLWDKDRQAFETWLKTEADNDLQKLVAIQPKTGIMIATPTHDGNVSLDYATGLGDIMACLAQNNIYFEFGRVVGSSLIPHARNSLVDMFLKSRCQKLLFIDSDQGFNRMDVIHLFQSPRKIIAGVTPHKRYPINLNFRPLDKDLHYFKEIANKTPEEYAKFIKEKADERGEIEVAHTGTGFLMIDRSVFEIMKEQLPKYLAFDDNASAKHTEFFKMGIGSDQRFKGEDWYFSEFARNLHIPIFINTNVMVSHRGNHTWALDIAQIKASGQ